MPNQAVYEVEIKSLLGSKENADKLLLDLENTDSKIALKEETNQLNHYFTNGDIKSLSLNIKGYISSDKIESFNQIINNGKNHSVRTRQKDKEVIFVIKSSVDETTSENGISRLEFEISLDISLDKLDKIILNSGYSYQAKWSRNRREYSYKDMSVCIDKNAGYGYLVEFEKITNNKDEVKNKHQEILEMMESFNIKELEQDRLQRMFEFYNKNWKNYYGTEKIFNIK